MIIITCDREGKESLGFTEPVRAVDFILNAIISIKTLLGLMNSDRLAEREMVLISALIRYMERYKYRSELLSKWFFELKNLCAHELVIHALEVVEKIIQEAKDNELIQIIDKN